MEISFSRLTVARVLITDYQTLNHEEKIKLNTTRGSAITEESRAALRQLKYYGRFLTELLTRSSANSLQRNLASTLSVEIVRNAAQMFDG